jgi:hypothetical protein
MAEAILVEETIDLSRVVLGKLELKKAPFDLRAAIEDIDPAELERTLTRLIEEA